MGIKYQTIYVDPPWQFKNKTGKVSPSYKGMRYDTLPLEEIKSLNVADFSEDKSHLYLWVPVPVINMGLEVLTAWGWEYKTMLIWEKVRKDGEVHGGGVGFYFRNAAEVCLFGVRGKMRTLKPGRTQPNIFRFPKTFHSQKPVVMYEIIESCSPGPYLELFARNTRKGWDSWGPDVDKYGER